MGVLYSEALPSTTIARSGLSKATKDRRSTKTAETSEDSQKDVVADLWRRYKGDQAPDARDQLIVEYSPLVKYVAGRVSTGLPNTIEQADLVSYGIFGLIDAIDKFDLDRGIKFETYAVSRIKGAIIDELRSIDWVPRSVRAKAREVEKTINSLENSLKRSPSDEEISEAMGIGIADLQAIYSQMSFVSLVALDEVMSMGSDRSDKVALVDTIEDTGAEDPVQSFEGEEMKQILSQAIDKLSEREKIVVTLYYYEGMTLNEIGQVLGVTESRVCQMHTKAVMQLRGRLAESSDN